MDHSVFVAYHDDRGIVQGNPQGLVLVPRPSLGTRSHCLAHDFQGYLVGDERALSSGGKANLDAAQRSLSAHFDNAAHPVGGVPHEHALDEPASVLVSGSVRRNRRRPCAHAGIVPALFRRRAAAAPVLEGGWWIVPAGKVEVVNCLARQIAEEHALHRIHRLPAKVTAARMREIQFFLGSRHADERQSPFLFQLFVDGQCCARAAAILAPPPPCTRRGTPVPWPRAGS